MLLNITPTHLRCSAGSCPAVYKVSDDTLAIIGTRGDSGIQNELAGKIAPNEEVVLIKADFFANVPEARELFEKIS